MKPSDTSVIPNEVRNLKKDCPPSPRLRRDFSEVRLRSLSFDEISPKLNAKAVQHRWTLAKENRVAALLQ